MRKLVALGVALALAGSAALAQGMGYGYGPGMMGGNGHGPGMMHVYGAGQGLANLSDEQLDKIFAIGEEHRRANWETMGRMRAERFKLQRLYSADSPDAQAVLEQQKKVDELRRQMLASRLDMHKQVQAVLTPEQRKQFRGSGPWWMGEDE